jgi:hypothetical protein
LRLRGTARKDNVVKKLLAVLEFFVWLAVIGGVIFAVWKGGFPQ